jgi:hypothetical protein
MCLPFAHKWKMQDRQEVTRTSNITNKVIGIWQVIILVCEKCGDVKSKKLNFTSP